jgi:hypothetical protein
MNEITPGLQAFVNGHDKIRINGHEKPAQMAIK